MGLRIKYNNEKLKEFIKGLPFELTLPEALLAANQDWCIRMPMREGARSLNLSNSVAVGVYEVLRQWDFPELLDHGHLRDYEWK